MFHWLDSATSTPAVPQHRNAIVTMAIGEAHAKPWDILCKQSWLAYAEKFGFDIIVIAAPLDTSTRAGSRSLSWQKLLAFNLPWAQRYERIVWIDADVIISPTAMNILAAVPDPAKVGLSRLGDQLSAGDQHVYMERLHGQSIPLDQVAAAWRHRELYIFRLAGIAVTNAEMFNGGVFVAAPGHHRQLFLDVYARDGESRAYEQPHLSKALCDAGIAHTISPRFNWNVHESMIVNFPAGLSVTAENFPHILFQLRNDLDKAYFLHFAGSMQLMTLVAQMAEKTPDLLLNPGKVG